MRFVLVFLLILFSSLLVYGQKDHHVILNQAEFKEWSSAPLYEKYGEVSALKVVYDRLKDQLYFVSNQDYEFHYEKNSETKKVKLNLLEHVTFINKGSIANKLSSLEEGTIIEINAEKSHYIDLDVLEIIYNFKDNAAYRNIQVDLVKFPERQKMSGH